jgi:DNA-binding MarR family transcriptional regulator
MATISLRTPKTGEPPLGLLIAVARARLKRRLMRDLGRYRVTPAQMGILFWLSEEGGLTLSEIAQRSMVDLPMVTRVVDRLVRAGLVARRGDTQDRRRVRAWLTPGGRALVPRLTPIYEGVNRELLRNVGRAEERSFRRTLYRLIANLEEKA